MATLTMTDYEEMRNRIYQWGQGKEEIIANPLKPNVPRLLATFQAIETFWEANRATLKSQMEIGFGGSMTNNLAKKILVSWLLWKVNKGG